MDALSRLFAVLTVSFTVGGVTSLTETPVVDTVPPVIVAQNATQRVWRDSDAIPKPKALCPQWWDTAIKAGWTIEQLPTLDYILHRESRCLKPSAQHHPQRRQINRHRLNPNQRPIMVQTDTLVSRRILANIGDNQVL
jgi:hypothetical protein